MKRSRRWVFNGIAALSLLVCVVTIGLWVSSYHLGLSWIWSSDIHRETFLCSGAGWIGVGRHWSSDGITYAGQIARNPHGWLLTNDGYLERAEPAPRAP